MFSTPVGTHVTSSAITRSFPVTPLRSLFEKLEQSIAQEQFDKVQNQLFVCFRQVQSEGEIQQCYQFLFELLPHCNSLGVLENNLPNLLDKSASLVKEQEQLALLLARRYLQEGELKKATLCFAKALQMNRSQDNYLAAFEVFLHYFRTHKEQRIESFLINPTPTPDTIASHLKIIETLKTFGISKEDLIPFFEKIHERINHVPSDRHVAYVTHEQAALDLCDSFRELQETAIERYWKALQTFRAHFAEQNTPTVQKEAFDAMKQLIALCIEDICILIGSPPCHYDLRAMGSLGRKEMCPYSDLECMLLIEDQQHRSYFTRMLELLELQIASLGETQGLNFVFTCLPNRSGFHVDNSPLHEQRLMQTPEQMAQLQQRTTYAGNDVECTVLKTSSLYQSTPQLYIDYQTHLQRIRKKFPFPFFDLCSTRTRDFSLAWKQQFDRKTFTYNIKEKFVETLYHPLSDLALYCGIESTNTLKIAEALIDRQVLPEEMRSLLKESLSLIYQIRLRTHLQNGTQKEDANLIPEEVATLEKCYWQILIPLHTCLKNLTVLKEPHRQFFEELCS
ncbi:MAG: putative nucleotidyltransferase substrate binding domain-containing protein, partial [Parachlamydiaceae bacterium]